MSSHNVLTQPWWDFMRRSLEKTAFLSFDSSSQKSSILSTLFFITIKIILWYKHNFLMFLLVLLLYIAKIKFKNSFLRHAFSVLWSLNMPLVSHSAFPSFLFLLASRHPLSHPVLVTRSFPSLNLKISYHNHYFVRVPKLGKFSSTLWCCLASLASSK